MPGATLPILKDLVLVGGGHAHVGVLKSWAMNPVPGVRVTLVTAQVDTPYSGMLPGLIAGHYTFDQAHLDLWTLARFAGVRCWLDRVVRLDLAQRQVCFSERPPLSFDLLSINIGSTPELDTVPGAREHAIPVKPIERFLPALGRIDERVRALRRGRFRIVVVGGGASGVELILSLQHRLLTLLREHGAASDLRLEFCLVTASLELLPTHNAGVRRCFRRILVRRGVKVCVGEEVQRALPDRLICGSGLEVEHDVLVWATQASAQPWIRESGLAVDGAGFLALNDCLQSTSDPKVFGAGDIAAVLAHPRPKAGVFAVRQGEPLALNLRRALCGERLEPFVPQRQFLSLISTGDCTAVASRGPWVLKGKWVWRWKRSIDVKWMQGYQRLAAPREKPGGTSLPVAASSCAGNVVENRGDFDFRLDDPYLGARLAANEALNELCVRGGRPIRAQVRFQLPPLPDGRADAARREILAGAEQELRRLGVARCELVAAVRSEPLLTVELEGTTEGAELSLGRGLQKGDRLVVTKAFGSGVIWAAQRAGLVRGKWVHQAVQTALQGNQAAADWLGAQGFPILDAVDELGLVCGLREGGAGRGQQVRLNPERLPILPGALELLSRGVRAPEWQRNWEAGCRAVREESGPGDLRFSLLFDPQSAGALVAAVPGERVTGALQALRGLGYADAADIGEVMGESEEAGMTFLVISH